MLSTPKVLSQKLQLPKRLVPDPYGSQETEDQDQAIERCSAAKTGKLKVLERNMQLQL